MSASRIIFTAAWLVGLYGLRNLPWPEFTLATIILTAFMIALGAWAKPKPEALPRHFGRITPRRRLLFTDVGGDLPQLDLTKAQLEAVIAACVAQIEDYAASGEEAPRALKNALRVLRNANR